LKRREGLVCPTEIAAPPCNLYRKWRSSTCGICVGKVVRRGKFWGCGKSGEKGKETYCESLQDRVAGKKLVLPDGRAKHQGAE